MNRDKPRTGRLFMNLCTLLVSLVPPQPSKTQVVIPAVSLVLSSVPASQEIGPVGHRVSAGSVSGGPDHRSDLRHPHGQRARRRILPRHHRESQTPPAFSRLSSSFSKVFLASLCSQLSFGAFLGIVGIHLVENRRPMVSLQNKQTQVL